MRRLLLIHYRQATHWDNLPLFEVCFRRIIAATLQSGQSGPPGMVGNGGGMQYLRIWESMGGATEGIFTFFQQLCMPNVFLGHKVVFLLSLLRLVDGPVSLRSNGGCWALRFVVAYWFFV